MSNFPRGYPGAPPSYPPGSSFAPPPPSAAGSSTFRPPSSGAAFFNPGTGGFPTAAASSNAPPANIPPPSYGAPNAPISSAPSYTPPGVGPPPASTSPNPTMLKPTVPFFSTGSGAPTTNQAFSSQPNFSPPPNNVAPPPASGSALGAPLMMPPPPTGAPVPPTVPAPYTLQYGVTNAPPANSMVGMPTTFDSGSNLAAQNQQAQIPGMDASGVNGAPPLPTLDEIDLSIQCNPNFLRSSVTKIVNSQSQANASRLPLGIVCKPMCGDKGLKNDEIEVVDFGATGIIRCKRCRTYINPYVSWTDNGRRWRCNICGMLNDVPSTYFSHLDSKGFRRDRDQRPELSKASVEFVAPGDYMVRQPPPPVYFFVIDVSEPAVSSGMLQSLVNSIKSSLNELPGGARTQIGIITFDMHIHFYNLKSSLSSPQMLVISDINDVIIPSPDDLLVNLCDSRNLVESLLDSLPSMFKANQATQTCTGPALMAAKRVIQHLGGKLCLFQCSLPSIGEGSLKMRENPRLLGTDKEHTLLNAEDPWYKTNGIDFSRLQVAVDTFLFSSQYIDLATISSLSKYTGGSSYYYPGFHANRDGSKFEKELQHNLIRSTAFEAVMRVRATRGLRFANFYGNYFIRGTDLLALPNCTSDSCFALDLAYDETQLQAQVITIQAALLYTNASGDRRIRVHTMVLPVTTSTPEMIESLDIDCAMNLLAKQSVDIAQKSGMENSRQRIHQNIVDVMRVAKSAATPLGSHGPPGSHFNSQAAAGPPQLPASLLLLPLYAMSLQKSLVLRGGIDVRIDERAFFQQLIYNMDIEESKVFIYPRMFSIHDMENDIGVPSDNPDDDCPTAGPYSVRLPAILNLSYERLSSNGIFLLENGYELFMWIGRSVNPAILNTLFNLPSLENTDMTTLAIIPENSDFSTRVQSVITALRAERSRYMQLHFIREGDGYAEAYFARYLIEDRANFSGGGLSYTEYHTHVTRAIG